METTDPKHIPPSQLPERKAWKSMMSRCYNAKDKNYASIGGVGITVCPEWHAYKAFLADVGPRPSADYYLFRDPESAVFSPTTTTWRKKVDARGHPLYGIWKSMRKRCGVIGNDNSTRKRYHARGIYVCERWEYSFENFAADMGKRPSPAHSLDRIDNDGPYSPENCRWATKADQMNNMSLNQWVEYGGERRTVSQWAAILGLDVGTFTARLGRCFSPDTKGRNLPINQLTLDGRLVANHASAKAAAATGVASYAAISKALSGGNASCAGYKWEYCQI